ncbi:hypothetical protein ACFWBI_20470 [Streptomyces sp. NPDC059982]|uniref:hypothetical protein n=1 Tax=unclassified Streptomyces TaxID=2593676 RepID=UPI00341ACDE6
MWWSNVVSKSFTLVRGVPRAFAWRGQGGDRAPEIQLERNIREMLRTLDVHPPLNVEELCQALSRSRGRHIELRSYPLPTPGPVGLWLETRSADLIVFQRETTPLHQDHIILHEVGHILADHRPESATMQWDGLLPGLNSDAIGRVLQRCSYNTEQEREAELIATIILEWASVLDRVLPPRHEDPSTRRIQAALGGRQGWL